MVTAGPASADATVPDPVLHCVLTDPRLAETSGLAWAPDGLDVVNDSGNASTVRRLDSGCRVVGSRSVAVDGRDVEDLARAADGTLWLSDTGDNDRVRTTVAMLRLPPRGGELVTRLTYPDGPHDTESLLLPADGRPVLVTKDLGGRSGVYTTAAPLGAAPGPVPLRRVATVTAPPSDTIGGPPFGSGTYTGGAVSVDGRVAALRTYTDAWLYPVDPGGSADAVVAALARVPVRVPLPGEPQGEAITFTPDGTLLSAGERGPEGGAPRAPVRAVPGATARVTAARPSPSPSSTPAPAAGSGGAGSGGAGSGGAGSGGAGSGGAGSGGAGSGGAGEVVAAVVVVLLVLLMAGAVIVVRRGRRRRKETR